jgi:hypothetical protein
MKLFTIKPTSKGTTRFTVLGKQGFYRMRSRDSRWGFGNANGKPSDSFKQVHLGKLTLAIESKKGRSLFAFAFNAK